MACAMHLTRIAGLFNLRMLPHMKQERILEVNDLRTRFHIAEGTVYAVNGVSFHLNHGEAIGIVGESGCGKSVTMM